jgi:hypothetical protein
MKTFGKRIKLTKWISSGPIAVRLTVEGVIPDEDDSEPCLESETVRFLDDVQRLANAGDVDALAKLGEVYVRRSA